MSSSSLALALALIAGCVSHQNQQSPKSTPAESTQLFGIRIRNSAWTLKEHVEKLYGKPLCVASYAEKEKCGTISDDAVEGSVGSAVITTEGTPVVLLTENGQNESTIVHELFHLKLRAEGFPILKYNVHKSLNRDVINLLMALVFTALEHRTYYPEMRRMGIDPDELERRELDGLISQQSEIVGEVQMLHSAATYFRTAIECGPECERERTLDRLSEWYERSDRVNSLLLAREMIATAKSNNPTTPLTVTNTAFQCVGQLLKGKVHINGAEWEERQRGKITEKLAPFYALPAN